MQAGQKRVQRAAEEQRDVQSCLEGGNDEERLDDAGAKAGGEAAVRGDLARVGVLERGLQHGVGAEPERVLEREVRGEGREPLPERAHALGAGHGGAAVRDAAVRPRAVELQPRLDDVDGLQAARLHNAAQGPRRRLDVGRDRWPAASACAALLGRGSRPWRRRRWRRLRRGGGGHSGSGGGGLTGFGVEERIGLFFHFFTASQQRRTRKLAALVI